MSREVRVIEFAGIDGVGKSTQAELLLANLRASGVSVDALPPRCFSHEVERAWTIYQEYGDAGVSHETLAIASAAALMFQSDLANRSSAGADLFIADRYVLSILAYSAIRGADMAFVGGCFSRIPLSEVGVLLVLDPSEAARRVSVRPRALDFDERDVERQIAIQKEFRRIVPDSWLVMDASGGEVETAALILEYVNARLQRPGGYVV